MTWDKAHGAKEQALDRLSDALLRHTMKRFGVDRTEALKIMEKINDKLKADGTIPHDKSSR